MQFHFQPVDGGKKTAKARGAFTLVEVLISLVILGLVMSGLLYGYLQSDRMAEWSSMSLAAQSYASQGVEQARAAQWNSLAYPMTYGPGNADEWPATNVPTIMPPDTLDIPSSGASIYVTNYIWVTTASLNPPLRQIRCDCVWAAALTGKLYTNTAITMRGPDQ